MKEIERIQKLKVWIASYFSESDLEIDEEVKLFLGDEPQKIKTDLVVIQSKSNVLHSFEVKNSLNDFLSLKMQSISSNTIKNLKN